MCLIALSDTGFEELTPGFWEEACAANRHGVGLMYHTKDNLVVRTWNSLSLERLLEQIEMLPKGVRVALHLRDATSGARSSENVHPHVVRFSGRAPMTLAVMHNGTIDALNAEAQFGPSDTALFTKSWLPAALGDAPHDWLTDELLRAVSDFAGPRNRFVLLDCRGRWQVLGADDGFQVGQTWLSNPKAKPWLPPGLVQTVEALPIFFSRSDA